MTLQEWLKHGEARLRTGPHPDRARRDAELLLMHATLLHRAALLARLKEILLEEEATVYRRLVKRRAKGEPIQYITGEAEFYGLPFRVGTSVLIPRPETEHLVVKAIEIASEFVEPRIVDVGIGSGAIAVTLANQLPGARVTATDISMGAILTARVNAERNCVADRIRFIRGDLLAPLASEKFDLVVSNPPYVPAADRPGLAVEVRDYEPAVALFAGDDGLDVIRRLVPAAFAALASGGALVMEFGYGQWPAVSALLADTGFAEIEFVPDLRGIPRIACGTKP
jgi:release factor glutamine methyltransferase